MDLGVRTGAAIGNGILTVESEAQALARADPATQDKGGAAALAALCLLALRRELGAAER
jgi:6,7-dimethyl-8-ribityllumazine synthase